MPPSRVYTLIEDSFATHIQFGQGGAAHEGEVVVKNASTGGSVLVWRVDGSQK